MARKIFWSLWVTVWPLAALIPPLVTAQGTRSDAVPAPEQKIVTPARRDATPARPTSPKTGRTSQNATRSSGPFETDSSDPPQDSSKTGRRNESIAPHPIQGQSDSAAFETSEPLPPTRNANENAHYPRTGSRTNGIRATGPVLSAREEAAQKLIHERAILRAQQRRARLEIKQGKCPTDKPPGWHPQSTDPRA